MQKQSLSLLQSRRFLPLFITQFFEAFNDTLFKTALLTLIAYTFVDNAKSSQLLVSMGGAIFILPFFFFSATAGQLADKFDKILIIRIIKIIEITAMLLGAVGFYYQSLPILMSVLFLLGSHSAFFGPIKYSILPDHLKYQELNTGNALVEASTFLSILLGSLLGSALIGVPLGTLVVSLLGLICALVGLVASFYIPRALINQPNLKISINFIKETFNIMKSAKENNTIFIAILGISWFWLIGIVILTQFPTYTRYELFADNTIYSIFLGIFSVGIGIGSMISARIQQNVVDTRLVPIGILGMAIFTIDLYFASVTIHHTHLIGVATFLANWHSWR